MMYGRARGHTQDDIMDIGLEAFRSEILGHMGYPRNWGYWENCGSPTTWRGRSPSSK